MFGFSLLINNSNRDYTFDLSNIKNKFVFDKGVVYDHMIDKFRNDKVFYEDSEFIVVIDGVILNKSSFCNEQNKNLTWPQIVISLYQSTGNLFFSSFRGSFSGLIYEKNDRKAVIFSDQIGSKFLYYYYQNDCLFVSSYISNIYDFLKANKLPYELSVENAYLLLSYGYMLDDRTLCSEIRKITPGCYLIFEDGNLVEEQYFLLDNTPDNSISEGDAIELMDDKFRAAVQLQFNKDIEYGYKHFVGLSAGLDSRMVTWVSHMMGFTNQLNFTFSQTEYWDETIPQKISTDLKHEWLFKSLDNGLWLYDIDKVVHENGGNVLYYGSAHANSLLKYLNYETFGILHNGQQGDIAFDTYYTGDNIKKQFCLGEGAFSRKYLDRINNIKLKQYKNEEIAHYYCRSFSGANNGAVIQMNYTEIKSPFADIDVLGTILKVPLQYRTKRNLYFKWIMSKYPDAAKYVWDHLGYPINRKYGIVHFGSKSFAIEQIPSKIINRITRKSEWNPNNMNPIGYYLHTNKELSDYINNYCNERLHMVDNADLRKDLADIISGNNPIEKIQAVSLLSAISQFFVK